MKTKVSFLNDSYAMVRKSVFFSSFKIMTIGDIFKISESFLQSKFGFRVLRKCKVIQKKNKVNLATSFNFVEYVVPVNLFLLVSFNVQIN